MYSEEIINRIMDEYDFLRSKAENVRQDKINAVYAKVSRIGEIDALVNRLGFENMKKIMVDPNNSKKYNDEFKQRLDSLRDEKELLIRQNNITADYEKREYVCEACSDTGFVDGKRCRCFEQKLIDSAYESSNISALIKDDNFDNFSAEYYSDEKLVDSKMSEREYMTSICNHCRKFCREFDIYQKNLLFYGNTGVGKTFLSTAIAKEILDKGKTVIYIRATRLFSMYEDYKFGRVTNNPTESLYSSDLLIIDDLGTEFLTKSSVPFLFDLVNDRIARKKKMIISTNFTMNDLTKIYTQRFVSRLYESFDILQFFGEDIRIKKMYK